MQMMMDESPEGWGAEDSPLNCTSVMSQLWAGYHDYLLGCFAYMPPHYCMQEWGTAGVIGTMEVTPRAQHWVTSCHGMPEEAMLLRSGICFLLYFEARQNDYTSVQSCVYGYKDEV